MDSIFNLKECLLDDIMIWKSNFHVTGDDGVNVPMEETEFYAPKNHPIAILCNKWRKENKEIPYQEDPHKGVRVDLDKAKIIIKMLKEQIY